MDISNFTTEDFVLEPSFRKWILHPDAMSNLKWEKLLGEFPSKYKEANKAREIIIHLSTNNSQELSENELYGLWEDIKRDLSDTENLAEEGKVIPIHPISILENQKPRGGLQREFFFHYRVRVACLLALLIGGGFLIHYFSPDVILEKPPLVEYEEHSTVPGVKAHLTLSDGSEVILNSGSKLRYVKNFEVERREVFLEGEAFFSVAKDSLRSFTVVTGKVKTTARGTSFNIKYGPETLDISLLTGKVSVEVPSNPSPPLMLIPGEALNIVISNSHFSKTRFDEELVAGWTKKLLVFQKTPLPEALKTLENWYGVTFEIKNEPHFKVHLSGKFHNETLENVLEGLGYAAKFKFEINHDKVNILF